MSNDGAAPRAAVAVSHARAEASRRNGAKSRGPRTAEGKARSRLNAIKHGMRALRYVVLPDESAAEFHALQEALMHELAPEGALQMVLARRVAVAAWRLARADPMEAEVFAERRWDNRSAGVALLGRRVGERGPNPVPAAKRRQRHPQLRDAAALPQRRHGRVHARAPHAQGAPGRAGKLDRPGRGSGKTEHRCAYACAPCGAAHSIPSRTERNRAASLRARGDRMGAGQDSHARARLA
jgi:hypothetical protein